MLVWPLITAIGISLAPSPCRATPLNGPDLTGKSEAQAVASAKHPTQPVHLTRTSARVCRDNYKLRMGVASWYGGTAVQRTASGEVFHANAMAAASRSLPFNTRVRVTNLRNGRSVVVRINDRGPFVLDRIIDLTPKAAAALGMKAHGTAPVYLEIASRETRDAAADTPVFDRR